VTNGGGKAEKGKKKKTEKEEKEKAKPTLPPVPYFSLVRLHSQPFVTMSSIILGNQHGINYSLQLHFHSFFFVSKL
jgi:hypothetical protein